MSENKQIVINKNLHQTLKCHCALTEQQIKEYTEAALEYAMKNKMSIEEMKEKQYKDSFASTSKGDGMIRYGGKSKKDEKDEKGKTPQELQEETIPIVEKSKKKTDDIW